MNDDLKTSLNTAKRISKILDAEFGVWKFKIGLDPIIGLLPVAGDTLSLILSSYIILTAFKFKLPNMIKAKMISNVVLDYIVGLVPLIGDIFDVAYKANIRNVKLLENYLYEKN